MNCDSFECLSCDFGKMTQTVKDIQIKHKNRDRVLKMSGLWCDSCAYGILNVNDREFIERQLKDFDIEDKK